MLSRTPSLCSPTQAKPSLICHSRTGSFIESLFVFCVGFCLGLRKHISALLCVGQWSRASNILAVTCHQYNKKDTGVDNVGKG